MQEERQHLLSVPSESIGTGFLTPAERAKRYLKLADLVNP